MSLWPAMRRNFVDASRMAVAVQRTIISPSLTAIGITSDRDSRRYRPWV